MIQHAPILIVDKDDNPIGEAGLYEAHEKGLIHRIVRIMVEDGKGNILLQKRSAQMKRWPHCWDNSVAGHVDSGEDYDVAAKRELFEELGIKNLRLTELGTYFTDKPLDNINLKRFNRVYKVKVSKTPKVIDPDEVDEVKWFSIDGAKKLIRDSENKVTYGLKDVIERYY